MRTNVATTRRIEVPSRGAGSSALGATDRERRVAGAPEMVTPERIRARAFEIFRARSGAGGDALADWLQAERELSGSRPLAQGPTEAIARSQ